MGRKADPEKKQRIVEAATEVFARKGFSRTRIIEVAEAAGIGKGTVYEYFESKEALFFAVFQSMFDMPLSKITLNAGKSSISVTEQIQTTVDNIVQSGVARLDHYSLVMEFWSAATSFSNRERYREIFKTEYSRIRDLCAGLIQQGIDDGEFSRHVDVLQVSAAIVGAVDALLLPAWLDPEFDAPQISRTFLDVLLCGLKSFKKEN